MIYQYTDFNGCFNWDTINILVFSKHLSISSQHLRSNIKIYPNPGSGKFIIEINDLVSVSKINISVHDIVGNEIEIYTIHNTRTTVKKEINIHNYPSGI